MGNGEKGPSEVPHHGPAPAHPVPCSKAIPDPHPCLCLCWEAAEGWLKLHDRPGRVKRVRNKACGWSCDVRVYTGSVRG